MRANPDRQRHLLHARDGGRRVPPAPSRGTLKTRKETMSAIWRSLVLKPKSATLSGQRTTTSMPNIISDRCAQTQKGRKRFCCRINADRIRRGLRLLTRFPGRPANLGRHAFRYQSERQIRDPFFYSIQRSVRPVRWRSFCLSPEQPG